jgi:hypothetical protein
LAKLFNRAWMTVSGTPGTGTITLLAAFSNAYLTFAEAGVANGDVCAYVLEDGDDFEIGIGTYTSAGTTFSRDTVTVSKEGGTSGTSKITASSAATIFLCPRKEEIFNNIGTTTNDDAAAGNVGEYKANFLSGTAVRSATVTMTIASPAVVTWTGHPFFASLTSVTPIFFTTTGALPTGVTASTVYYATWIDANTFHISTTIANALAGTYINTSGTQSGTHTGDIRISQTTATARDMAAIQLTAGDWEVQATVYWIGSGSAVINRTELELHTSAGAGMSYIEGRYGSDQFPASYTPESNTFKNINTPVARFSLSATTTIYAMFISTFTVSTLIAYCALSARRAR